MVWHCVVLLKRLRYPSTLHYSLILLLLLNWWGFGIKQGICTFQLLGIRYTIWTFLYAICEENYFWWNICSFYAFVLIFLKIYFWSYLKKRFFFSFYFIFSVGMQIVKIWEAAMTSAMLSSFFPIVTKWINN